MKKEFDEEKVFLIETVVGGVVLLILIAIAVFLLYRNGRKDIEEVTSETVSVESQIETISEEEVESTSETSSEDAAVTLATENRKELPIGEYPQEYIKGEMLAYDDANGQLKEIASYWSEYQLEAVWDLINLPRVRKVTTTLKNTNDYYYVGDVNSSGKPNGNGLAVYASDTYYYGEWKDGLRDGKGMWVRLFIDKDGIVNGVSGVKEHQYSGEWKADYPCGEGQETFIYDKPVTENEYIIRNVIGGFKDGFYNGQMYIITQDKEEEDNVTDWYGKAEVGSFVFLNNKKNTLGKRAIWEAGEGFETGEQDNCRWIMPVDNMDFGFAGLKKK